MDATVAVTKALADASRLRILMSLRGSPLCLCHLTEILGLAPSTISKHLQILTHAGLVASRQEGRWRFYRLAHGAAGSCPERALEWVFEALRNDAAIAEDQARRALALGSCGAPSPRDEKRNVLFLCTGNACRSQMAEAFLRYHAGDRFEAFSAGLEPRKIPAMTVSVMKERGVRLEDHRPKSVMEFLGKVPISFLVVMCGNAEARCPVFPGVAHRLFWPIEAPSTVQGTKARRARFQEIRDLIEKRILAWLEQGPERVGATLS
jgi:arsenate reductase